MKTKNIFRMLLVAATLLMGANNVEAQETIIWNGTFDEYNAVQVSSGDWKNNLNEGDKLRIYVSNRLLRIVGVWNTNIGFEDSSDGYIDFTKYNGQYFEAVFNQSTLDAIATLRSNPQWVNINVGANITVSHVKFVDADGEHDLEITNNSFDSYAIANATIGNSIRIYATIANTTLSRFRPYYNDGGEKLKNTNDGWIDCSRAEALTGYVDYSLSSQNVTDLRNGRPLYIEHEKKVGIKRVSIVSNGSTPTTKTTPTLSFNTTTFNIAYGEVFTAPTATCSVEGLAISYTSSDDNIAEVNSSTGDVTIKKAGQVRITANTEETDTYNAASAYYDINIAKIVYNLAYSASTATAVIGESWTAPTLSNPSLLSVTYSSTNTNVATIDQNGNVEIVAAGETTIKAVYAGDDNHERLEASYVLTVSEQQQQPQPTANYITVDMGSYEYRTYVTTTNIDFSQSIGINGYYATGLTSDGTKVQFRKVTGVVAASVPLLLQKVSGATEYKLLTTDTSGSVPSPNKLVAGGTNSWISGSNIFVLTVHNGQLVFAETNINSANVNNEHAYLNLRGSNARSLMISFSDDEDEATEIDAIVSNEQDTQDIYDLRGLRVQKPTKGVYIINGKKMVIK